MTTACDIHNPAVQQRIAELWREATGQALINWRRGALPGTLWATACELCDGDECRVHGTFTLFSDFASLAVQPLDREQTAVEAEALRRVNRLLRESRGMENSTP